jgi:hypothetical protein
LRPHSERSNGIADLLDPMLKDRIAELMAIRNQARADAERAEDEMGLRSLRGAGFRHNKPERFFNIASNCCFQCKFIQIIDDFRQDSAVVA